MRSSFDWRTANDKKVVFVGNGGSSAIASHMASTFQKTEVRAVAFNDFPTLTMLGNDFGYESVFAKQLDYYVSLEILVRSLHQEE